MFLRKKILSFIGIFALFLSLTISGCGSSSSSGGSSSLTAEQEEEFTNLILTIAGLSSALFSEIESASTITCTGGGTITNNTVTGLITATDCIEEGLTINGTFAISESGTETTAVWNFTVTGSGIIITISGSMQYDDSDGSLTATLVAVYNGTIISINVNLTINDAGITGTVSFSGDGASVVCTFSNFDTDTAAVSDYINACGI